ncbi:MAG TPA: hypothetical protein VFB90_07255 [Dehalococcoidia bacterium]|nr:hypothetical protein [Dehalococcoidia bacterium]
MQLTDPEAIQQIAALLDAKLEQAPFQVRGEVVYQLSLDSAEHQAAVRLTIWPSQSRVDVRLGKSYWVLKEISGVELYPGVEVLFRREEPSALLFVSKQGRVALVS